jgi:serine phosphatase RsbU (regulator of sigma subunit)
MKFLLAVLFIICIAGTDSKAVVSKTDSLKKILGAEKDGFKRIDLMNEIALLYVNTAEHDSILKYARTAMELAENTQYDKGVAESHKRIAAVYYDWNDNEKALSHYHLAYEFYLKIKDHSNIAVLLTSLGNVYQNQNNYNKALDCFIRSVDIIDSILPGIKEKTDLIRAKANNYNNIGNVHYYLKNPEKTVDFYKKALAEYEKINDQASMANMYSNMGMMARMKKDFIKSVEYRKKALDIFTKTGNKEGMAYANMGLGLTFHDMNNRGNCFFHLNEALKLYNEMGSKKGALMIYLNFGEIFASNKQYEEAIKNISKAELLADSINSKDYRKEVYWAFTSVYKLMGEYRKALDYSLLFSAIKDSLYNESSQQLLTEMQTRFETREKEKENELLKNESRIQQLELKKKEAEVRQQRIIIAGVAVFVLLLGTFLFLLYRMFNEKKKNNLILQKRNHEISVQKEEIQAQRDEILSQRDMLSEQKSKIEYIHKELTDSIQYAKRIQNAILPPKYYIDKILPENFIFYRAKDVVSGDFYFFHKAENKIIFAAVDCTGHGVPGALMSVIGYNWLVQAVRENIITSPDKILTFLDDGVNKTLRQTAGESGVSDGMDLALCTLDISTGELQYAGAFNSLYYTHNNELYEIKADKKPIGTNVDGVADQYTNHIVPLAPGDMIYLFSDGYPDQFGGPKGKKFKYKPLKELLLKLSPLPVAEQNHQLGITLQDWQGNLEQVDDIVIIGIRMPAPNA